MEWHHWELIDWLILCCWNCWILWRAMRCGSFHIGANFFFFSIFFDQNFQFSLNHCHLLVQSIWFESKYFSPKHLFCFDSFHLSFSPSLNLLFSPIKTRGASNQYQLIIISVFVWLLINWLRFDLLMAWFLSFSLHVFLFLSLSSLYSPSSWLRPH